MSISLDIYGHLLPEMQDEAAELIDDLITLVDVDLPKNQVGEVTEKSNTGRMASSHNV